MELKPGYKQTEVGVIPSDWDVSTVGNLFRITAGGDVDRKRSQSFFDEVHRYPIYSNALTNLGLYGYCSYADHPKGSLTITARGMVGHANFRDHDYTAIGRVLVLQPNVKVAGVYFAELINNTINFADESTGVPQLTAPQISKYQLPVPSFPEQQAIAEALSDADALIESLDQLIAKKRQIKQGAMQELLTGKRRLPGFSGNWEVRRLGDICEIDMGRTPPRLNSSFWGVGHKWLSIADLKSKVVTESKEEITPLAAEEMQVVRKGTLLMSFKLSIGRLCFAGCDLYTNEAICSFNQLKANSDFLYYVLGRIDFSLYGKQAVKGYTLNKESLKLVEVPLPSIQEQTAIASVLSDMDTELAALESRLAKARLIKQGMMQELLTGRIRLL